MKNKIKERVVGELINVCFPDTRFHFDLTMYIPDFPGSNYAALLLNEIDSYENSDIIFVTPDNSLVSIRKKLLADNKTIIVSTYGIQRGFYVLDPSKISASQYDFAATLDGMEFFSDSVSLHDVLKMTNKFDFLITGALVVDEKGSRFGKGHGYFDIECGMFTDVGLIDDQTLMAAVVHDCQVYPDKIPCSETDVAVDYILTNTRLVKTENNLHRVGIDWTKINEDKLLHISPLKDLKEILRQKLESAGVTEDV